VSRARRIAECAAINQAAGEAAEKTARVRHPISKLQHTRGLILLFLDTIGRPARTSEIRKAVLRWCPEAAVYGGMVELQCEGHIKRLSHERDALFAIVVRKAP
jgi:hypothetical protein